MRISYLLAAALALAWVPGRAAAVEECPPSSSDVGGSGSTDVQSNIGSDDSSVSVGSDSSNVECPPSSSDRGAIGGSAAEGEVESGTSTRSDSVMDQQKRERMESDQAAREPGSTSQTVIIASDEDRGREEEAENKGLTVGALGGVSGYAGALAPRVEPGGSWGVAVTAQPTKILGIELNYLGAFNNIDDPAAPNGEIIRNGGNVNLKFALSPTPLEPYLFGGVGIARANVRDAPGSSIYRDDTYGQVPLGAGVNFHIGDFTAGLRASYNVLFDQEFALTETNSLGFDNKRSGDTWDGQLQLGATF